MSAPSVGTLCCRATASLDGFSSAINLCTALQEAPDLSQNSSSAKDKTY